MATVAIRIWNLIYVKHVRNVWKKERNYFKLFCGMQTVN